jgi:chromosome segregation ATPase
MVLSSRPGWLSHLGLVASLAGIMALGLAATTPQPAPKAIQTQRLEIVTEAGQVLIVARATAQGGHVEVRNAGGDILFSVGVDPEEPALPGMWKQTLRKIDSQGRDLTHHRRTLDIFTRQLRQVEQQVHHLTQTLRPAPDLERQRRDMEQQRRGLDALERQVNQLRRQVQTLERR